MEIIKRIKKFIVRLFVLVRKKNRQLEARLDEVQPHPVAGVLIIIVGAVIALAGVAMLVLPGPGTLVLALGIAAIIVGTKTMRGSYGPHRVERERAKKHERLARMRARHAAKKGQRQAAAPAASSTVVVPAERR